MKILLNLFIFSMSITLNSQIQSHIIFDSIEKKPLPFANIKYGISGMYSNEKGIFQLPKGKIDSILITYTGSNGYQYKDCTDWEEVDCADIILAK